MKIILMLTLFVLTACVSPMPHASMVGEVEPDSYQATELTNYAQSLLGVPYRYGGSSPDSGFDCSGFVTHVFRQTLDIELPRSSIDISRHGIQLKREELHLGDLVFFNTRRHPYSHVGIYLGDDHFIHSPSRGESVRIDDMNSHYWQKNYNGARRIMKTSVLEKTTSEETVLQQFSDEQTITEPLLTGQP